jgi:hypothetical protein
MASSFDSALLRCFLTSLIVINRFPHFPTNCGKNQPIAPPSALILI